MPDRHRRPPLILLLGFCLGLPLAATAGPTVVPTSEGQIGTTPAPGDTVIGRRIEPLPASGTILFGGLFEFGGTMPPPPAFSFLTDEIHGAGTPAPVNNFPGTFNNVFKLPPQSASSPNGDFVAFSFAVDGSMAMTMSVRIATFDKNGNALANLPLADVETFPDPTLSKTGVAVDDQGRVTVVYTEVEPMMPPRVRAQRFDAVTGAPLGGVVPVSGDLNGSPDIALLDPSGDRLIVAHAEFSTGGAVNGNIIDTTGPTTMVLPEFPISTTPGFANFTPAVAADPATGAFTVVWQHLNENVPVSNPTDVRARRFDAQGNPIGNDFVVNTTTAGDQGQPHADAGPNGQSAIVWAGVDDDLDVFAQVFDASGQPIGGEIQVNSQTSGEQSNPWVRYLPGPDPTGRPQIAVVWRDVQGGGDLTPNGTGTGSRCFSVGDAPDPMLIFEDGFESGDTSSWSCKKP